jgi:hypothetical protein
LVAHGEVLKPTKTVRDGRIKNKPPVPPLGHPKWGGRKKGTPNKSTADIRQAALEMAPKMLKVLRDLALKSENDAVRKDAAFIVLQYAVGKPKESADINVTYNVEEAARTIIELSARAEARKAESIQ